MVQELFRAVASNDATAIRSLVARHGPGMLEARNAAGMRAVEVALERGQRRAYRELERHGMPPPHPSVRVRTGREVAGELSL